MLEFNLALNLLQIVYSKCENDVFFRWILLFHQISLCQLMRFGSLWKAIKQWTLCSHPCQYSDNSPLSTHNYLIPISFRLFKYMQIKVAANELAFQLIPGTEVWILCTISFILSLIHSPVKLSSLSRVI